MAALTFEYLGLSSIKMTVKYDVGEVVLITDPFDAETGVKMPRGATADIVLSSTSMKKNDVLELVGGETEPFIVDHAGEFESKGIFVYGKTIVQKKGEKESQLTIYRIEAGDLSIAFLGGLNRPLKDEEVELFGDVNVLMLPVGGQGVVLDATQAVEEMTSLEPRIVIPLMYQIPGLKIPVDPVERFVKESGIAPERVEKLKLAKKDLPTEETKMYILS